MVSSAKILYETSRYLRTFSVHGEPLFSVRPDLMSSLWITPHCNGLLARKSNMLCRRRWTRPYFLKIMSDAGPTALRTLRASRLPTQSNRTGLGFCDLSPIPTGRRARQRRLRRLHRLYQNAENSEELGITPYRNRIMPPRIPHQKGFPSLSQSQTRYPPPISAKPARTNKTIALANFAPLGFFGRRKCDCQDTG